ncbi:MAG TPA: prevent-host-death protein [Actinomycetes bacterium]|nr:prevent-host-death protein [Actinomycetes bacterium]
MTSRHFTSYTQARQQFRAVLDAASSGLVTTIDRDDERFLVVSAEQQRRDLAALLPSRASVVAEGGGWAVILPGLPVHGDGETFDDAIDDALAALREYAEDWNTRLRLAPNHAQNHVLVELVELSDDDQLRDWLVGGGSVEATAEPGAQHRPERPLPA